MSGRALFDDDDTPTGDVAATSTSPLGQRTSTRVRLRRSFPARSAAAGRRASSSSTGSARPAPAASPPAVTTTVAPRPVGWSACPTSRTASHRSGPGSRCAAARAARSCSSPARRGRRRCRSRRRRRPGWSARRAAPGPLPSVTGREAAPPRLRNTTRGPRCGYWGSCALDLRVDVAGDVHDVRPAVVVEVGQPRAPLDVAILDARAPRRPPTSSNWPRPRFR